MKKKPSQSSHLAALHALGALDGADARAFATELSSSVEAQNEAKAFEAIAENLARSLPAPELSPGLKQRILEKAEQSRERQQAVAVLKSLAPASEKGLAFLKNVGAANWVVLPVSGAFVKLLSFDENSAHAVVLGKLEPGSRYPAHRHLHPEDIYMLSGDLHVGEAVLHAGDFHHADAGSEHPVNWSEHGCTLLCVLSKEDLVNQLG